MKFKILKPLISITTLIIPLGTIIACSKPETPISEWININLASEEGHNLKTDLINSNIWSQINGVNVKYKINSENKFIAYYKIDGKDQLDSFQQLVIEVNSNDTTSQEFSGTIGYQINNSQWVHFTPTEIINNYQTINQIFYLSLIIISQHSSLFSNIVEK